jgi:hypothetical protein
MAISYLWIVSKNPEEEGPVGRLKLDERIILKQILLDGSV